MDFRFEAFEGSPEAGGDGGIEAPSPRGFTGGSGAGVGLGDYVPGAGGVEKDSAEVTNPAPDA